MYQKPALQRLGTFRELTRLGFTGNSDGGSIFGLGGASGRGRGRDRHIQRDDPTAS